MGSVPTTGADTVPTRVREAGARQRWHPDRAAPVLGRRAACRPAVRPNPTVWISLRPARLACVEASGWHSRAEIVLPGPGKKPAQSPRERARGDRRPSGKFPEGSPNSCTRAEIVFTASSKDAGQPPRARAKTISPRCGECARRRPLAHARQDHPDGSGRSEAWPPLADAREDQSVGQRPMVADIKAQVCGSRSSLRTTGRFWWTAGTGGVRVRPPVRTRYSSACRADTRRR